MTNQFFLIGRLVGEVKKEVVEDKTKATITLAVNRYYKNEEGVYDTDFLDITLYGSIADTTAEYCKNGDLIGTKGRIENNGLGIELIAEKITFLNERKEKEENE